MRKQKQSSWERLRRSGLGTFLVIVAVLGAGVLAWEAHLRGKFHRLTTTEDRSDGVTADVHLGGQPLVLVTRTAMPTSMTPEFTQVTVAPGLGMLMLNAMLQSPGRAEETVLEGTREADLQAAGAHPVGAEFHAIVAMPDGPRWTAPVELIAGRPSAQQDSSFQPGGNRSEAAFLSDATSPSGATVHTGVDTTVTAATTSRGLELTLTARNTSTGKRTVVLDWRPRFLAPDTGLSSLSYVPPREANGGSTSGEQVLGQHSIDHTYGPLQHSYLGSGPELVLHNRSKGYALRMTAMSSAMRSVHVQADKNGSAVLIAFSTADGTTPTPAATVLMPGEKLDWHLRIEALPETSGTAAAP